MSKMSRSEPPMPPATYTTLSSAAAPASARPTGIGLSEPLPSFDAAPYLSFAPIGKAQASAPDEVTLVAMNAEPQALTFLPPPASEPDDTFHRSTFDASMGHGRCAAPSNALRRQVLLRAVSPRTADELAGFFRDVSFTLLTDIRQGEAVPAINSWYSKGTFKEVELTPVGFMHWVNLSARHSGAVRGADPELRTTLEIEYQAEFLDLLYNPKYSESVF